MSDSALAVLRARAQHPNPITWVFLGDSITHGAQHTWGSRAYVELFDERVRWEMRRTDDVVINTGYSGYRVTGILDTLEHRCLRFKPDVVSIMVGMNDSTEGIDGIAAFEEHYLQLIERISTETSALVFINTTNIIDASSGSGLSRTTLPQYNEAIRRVAQRAGVPLCDHYAVWEQYEGATGLLRHYLLNEPIHPNADGHRLFASTLLRWIGYGPLEKASPLATFMASLDKALMLP